MQLKQGTLLQGGKYRIEKVLGQGGFGITYLAYHEMLECKIAIKEFFFKEYCNRDSETNQITLGTLSNRNIVDRFQNKFIKEAKTIFKLRHPNVIQIHDIFTENGTAYYVMEYIEGDSLGDLVKKNGALNAIDAIAYIKGIGNALSYIHSMNINHLDIKPGNIMLRKSDNQVILIDFGVAKQYDTDTLEGTTTTPVGISHGYSPLEQYRSNGVQEFSPQSDVYALAATLFKLLTGVTPPEAIEVQEEGLPVEELQKRGISERIILSIEAAMQSRKKRTQTVEDFINSIDSSEELTTGGTITENENQVVNLINEEEESANEDALSCSELDYYEKFEEEIIEDNTSEETQLAFSEVIPASTQEVLFCNKYGLMQNETILVDLGLSVLWSTCNIGAASPASIGNQSLWENETFKKDGNALRLPSTEEFKELKEKCMWKWIEDGDICGYQIKSPMNGNKIFLRASGKIEDNMTKSSNMGFYWSNSKSADGNNAYCMTFMSGTILCYVSNSKSIMMSMRFVCSK